ncbi:group 1 truncated hemoglobin [Halogeometricum borinquense]|uniref:Group 1 truncated hemoglobin n=1 Tax=Halogeometricum borinquense TaxID=60847 RepID=A0A6C0UED7_9EURY|nr:group 1 truncated hemoglobin [Halogeometricum borinquense]QIB73735.1 group 1 truncated hemoglobin [Halogeometricum borinquense]QIQ76907.1 group 1 truncated hemoglobin [Halogeometricum borinquense]
MSDQTLYRRLGGRDALASVVDTFYDRILADDELRPFFEDVDMTKQRAHQTQFLSAVAGGPVEYDGENMAAAHEHLDISHEEYDAIAAHLDAALEIHDVPADDRETVLTAVESFRDDIVTIDASPA